MQDEDLPLHPVAQNIYLPYSGRHNACLSYLAATVNLGLFFTFLIVNFTNICSGWLDQNGLITFNTLSMRKWGIDRIVKKRFLLRLD